VDPGEIRLDPGLEIQIRHACVSLDETWDLRVADARLGRLGDLLVRGRDEVLRLRSLSGTLAGHLVGEVFVGSPLEGVEVEIDLSFDAIDPATAAFEGTVQVTAFRIEGVAPWSVDLKAQLCLTPGEWRLEHVSGTLAGVSLAGRLAGVPGAIHGVKGLQSHLEFSGLDGGLIVDCARRVGRSPVLGLPESGALFDNLRVGGSLDLDPDGRLRGRVEVQSRSSCLFIDLNFDDEVGFTGTRATARIAVAEFQEMVQGFFPGPAKIDGELHGEFRVEGMPSRIRVQGRFFSPRLHLGPSSSMPALDLDEVSLEFRILDSTLVLEGLKAGVLGGSIRGSFRSARGPNVATNHKPHELELEILNLRTEILPTSPSGDRGLAGIISGALSGKLRITGHLTRLGSLVGGGELSVDDPQYRGVRSIATTLAKYGLPPLSIRGKGSARARIVVETGVTFEDVQIDLKEARVRGRVRIDLDRTVDGRLEALVEKDYLVTSPMLALPASLSGGLTIPIEVRGDISDPQINVDFTSALGSYVEGTRIGSTLRGAFETMWSAFEGQPVQPGPELDLIIQRILEGGPGGEETLSRLIDTGISADEITYFLEDYRRRKG